MADVQAKAMIAEARSGVVAAAQATILARGELLVDYLHGKCGPLAREPDAPSTGAEVSAAGGERHDGAGGGSKYARAEHTQCVTPGYNRSKPPAAAPAVCDVYIVQVVCVCVRVCVCVCVWCLCCVCVCVCIYTHTHTQIHTHTHTHTYINTFICATSTLCRLRMTTSPSLSHCMKPPPHFMTASPSLYALMRAR
jgi:hypothetical protein